MKYSIAAFVSLLLLAACGDVSSGQKAELIKLCQIKLEVPEEVCKCVGKKAQDELTEDERAVLIAMIDGDKNKIDDVRGSMSAPSMMKAGMFMAMAPGECAKEAAE
ncbi:MAG: hypothetical protein DHS20C02_10110 [Micavibrio sp.]|nr:MAG: hypothetical protein DHS20C02_10110 [Micavibrio sp.]